MPSSVDSTLGQARIATYSLFALNGFLLGLWVVHIPAIRDRAGITNATLGLLLLVMGAAAWLAMQFIGRVIDTFGSARVATIGILAMCAALVLPGLATNATTLTLALLALGLTNGAVDVAQNAQAADVEREYGRPMMSSFHALFSAGGLTASLVGGALLHLGVPVPVNLLIGAGLCAVAMLTQHRRLLPHTRQPDDVNDPAARPPWTGRVLLLGLLAFVLMLSEGVAYDWSTVHLRDVLGTSQATAALAYGAFSTAMMITRLVADRAVAAWGPGRFVQRATVVGAVGVATAALAPTVPIALVGWALFGIGLAGCVPQFFSAAGNVDPRSSGTYIARVAALGYVGLLAGPSIIGGLTAFIPLTAAFTVPVIGCLVAGALAPKALDEGASR